MRKRGLAALAALTMLSTALAAPPRIAIDDKPLDVAAIVQHDRVLVPMRAIFEGLGADLRYDAVTRTVVADGGGRSMRLQIGARRAIVDDRPVTLDVPARIVGASTYVPLRFVAQALGAVVGYDAGAGIVTVYRHPGISHTSTSVTGLQPALGAVVASAYPTISGYAQTDGAALTEERLTLDGVDVTGDASFDGSTFSYIPSAGLAPGDHDVGFQATDDRGRNYAALWSFSTTLPAPPDAGAVPLQFYVEGADFYGYGQPIDLVLIAPPGGTAYVTSCASPFRNWMYDDAANPSRYRLSLPAPYGYENGSCPFEAVYIAWNGTVQYVPVPIFIRVAPRPRYRERRPHDRPTPRPTPRPTAYPTAYPSAAPTVAPFPHPPRPHPPRVPDVTPQPRATAEPRPTPQPTVAPAPEPTPAPQPRPRGPRSPRPLETPARG